MIVRNYKALADSPARKKILKIMDAGIEACKPKHIIRKNISLKKNILSIKNKRYNLKKFKNVYLIGFGKMSASAAKEIEKIIKIKGIIIDTEKIKLRKIESIKGTHPLPSQKNIKATKRMIDLVNNLDKDDLVLCIVSGGGSSLLCSPNIPFNKYMKKLKKVIFSGIDIKRLNQFRKRYSNVKAGKLAKMIHPAKIINLYFSDVIGDDFKVIASGPTYSRKADNILILNNKVCADAMAKKAGSLGLKPKIYTTRLKGEARNIGKRLLKKVNMCLIAAGETTVTVKGKGKGGRNQELCLGVLKNINDFTLASIDSDGIDGITDAAGAIIDIKTLNKAENIDKYLKNNNSYNFFKRTNSLIYTGKTGINLMDFVVIIR